MCLWSLTDMYPRYEKMTNPEKRLVNELTATVIRQSLRHTDTEIQTHTDRYRRRHRHSEDSSFVHFLVLPFDAHCCYIKHPVPDRVKPVMYNFSHPGTLDTQF